MPRQNHEHYRYQRAYTRLEHGSPHFDEIRQHDLDRLEKELPEGCEYSLVTNYFCFHDKDNDLFIFYHFENKDEMMGYMAACYNDPEIYHNWKREQAEEKQLAEYYWRERNAR